MFSIIIPSYNSASTIQYILPKYLEILKNRLIREVIIVDSSQQEATLKILLDYESRMKIIRLHTKTYPSIARNIGATASSGKILAFFDADTYPDSSWFEKIMDAYNNGCMIGGGSILIPSFQEKKVIPLAQYYLQLSEYMNVGFRRPKKFVPACNLFCNKELFEKTGGFPNIRAAEEVLFGLKLGKIEKIWFIPEAKVYHIFREDLKSSLKNQMLLGEYNIIYRRQFYNSRVYKGVIPLVLLPSIFCLKLFRIILRISNARFKNFLSFFYCFPFFILGLTYWSVGFAKGAIKSHRGED